ncbi:MAG: M20/M25/M40 family metallo-hydrolase [Oscillospiraceae bacterium]|jgi:hypothetical protein|nr:M20/M25/M40 family metallo-hydrolase [Oscillospiraceae bacterium]
MKAAQQQAQQRQRSFHLEESAKNAAEAIGKLLGKYGPRAPGSEAEWKAQLDMAAQMESWADRVETEDFPVHRQAFMGFIPFTVTLAMAAALLFWFGRALPGLILVAAAALPLVLEFAMYREFCDRLFKAYPSHNVIATRKAEGETRRRIFLIGHADSQYEWTLLYRLGGVGMKLVLIPAVVGLVICFAANLLRFTLFDLAGLADAGFLHWLFRIAGIALFVLFPCDIGFLFFQSHRKSVPGASDNLSGCYTAMSVLRELADADIRFPDTEVVVLLTGSEEAGLRGAKAYLRRHKNELKTDKAQTIALGLDTFRDIEHMAVYDRDMSGTVRHDAAVRALLKQAGANCGYDLPFASIYIGACDAAAFTQAGVQAAGFAAMDPTPPRWYHTRLDDMDHLNPEAIRVGTEITLEAVCLFAEEGLPAVPSAAATK